MMRNLFLMIIALIMGIQSCFAAEIDEARLNGNADWVYPVIFADKAEVSGVINSIIREEIRNFVAGIYDLAQESGYEVADIRTSYEIPCNQAGNTVILSVLITKSTYFKGTNHPQTWRRALNFNLANGELMGINYLTDIGEGVPESYYIDKIEQKLAEKVANGEIFLFENALPLKNLPQDFYFDENLHVHFIFQQYDIAPYAAGIIDLDMN